MALGFRVAAINGAFLAYHASNIQASCRKNIYRPIGHMIAPALPILKPTH